MANTWLNIKLSLSTGIILSHAEKNVNLTNHFWINLPLLRGSEKGDKSFYGQVRSALLRRGGTVLYGFSDKLSAYCKGGGNLIAAYFSGIVDQHDLVTLGRYPGRLREILDIWVEETDALPKEAANLFIWKGVVIFRSKGADFSYLAL